jgi:hypothetical protein
MEVNPETLKALKGSILKWEKIKAGEGGDRRADNCPLCEMFRNDPNDECSLGGDRCPVRIAARRRDCGLTPYVGWLRHHEIIHERSKYDYSEIVVKCDECKRLAKLELDFLVSLLPKE